MRWPSGQVIGAVIGAISAATELVEGAAHGHEGGDEALERVGVEDDLGARLAQHLGVLRHEHAVLGAVGVGAGAVEDEGADLPAAALDDDRVGVVVAAEAEGLAGDSSAGGADARDEGFAGLEGARGHVREGDRARGGASSGGGVERAR